jgi:putative Holliday junction resolvase
MSSAGRILAVDPGEKHIGLALSDPTLTLASPLVVLKHISLLMDAAQIARLAEENAVQTILVGEALGADGEETAASRHSRKLAESIQSQTPLPVLLWDESGSTQTARQARIEMGVKRAKRSGHMDDLAAVVILQTYLDERNQNHG